MDMEALSSFISIVEEGGMTKAASVLHISQSAMSSSIGKLEKELGAALFDRGGKGLQLTMEGEFFLTWAKRLVSAIDEGKRSVQEAITKKGIVKIGTFAENDGIYYLVSAFCKKYPQITVYLYDRKSIWADFLSSDLDFFVLPKNECRGLPSVNVARRKNLYVLMGSGHRLAKRALIQLKDLQEERFVFTASADGKMDSMYTYCVEHGFEPRVSFLCEEVESLLDIILQTGAVTLVYNTFRQFRQRMDGLSAVPLDGSSRENTEIVLAWRDGNDTNPLADIFKDFAVNYMEREYRR